MWDEALDFGVRGTKLMQVLFGSLRDKCSSSDEENGRQNI